MSCFFFSGRRVAQGNCPAAVGLPNDRSAFLRSGVLVEGGGALALPARWVLCSLLAEGCRLDRGGRGTDAWGSLVHLEPTNNGRIFTVPRCLFQSANLRNPIVSYLPDPFFLCSPIYRPICLSISIDNHLSINQSASQSVLLCPLFHRFYRFYCHQTSSFRNLTLSITPLFTISNCFWVILIHILHSTLISVSIWNIETKLQL